RLQEFVDLDDEDAEKKRKQRLQRSLAGATLIVDVRVAGLKDGLLDDKQNELPRTVDDGVPWMDAGAASSQGQAPVVRFRVRSAEAGHPLAAEKDWRERLRFAAEVSDDREPMRWLVVWKWRHDAATEEDR